jgi:hypothetical protein
MKKILGLLLLATAVVVTIAPPKTDAGPIPTCFPRKGTKCTM